MSSNVQVQVEGNKLILTVDLTKDFGPSKSGKTHIVATTNGFTKLAGGSHPLISFGLNVIKAK